MIASACLRAASVRSSICSRSASACLRAASVLDSTCPRIVSACLRAAAVPDSTWPRIFAPGRLQLVPGCFADLLAHPQHLLGEIALPLEHLLREIEDLIDHLVGVRGCRRHLAADLAEGVLGDLRPRLYCVDGLRLGRPHCCRELFLGRGHEVPSGCGRAVMGRRGDHASAGCRYVIEILLSATLRQDPSCGRIRRALQVPRSTRAGVEPAEGGVLAGHQAASPASASSSEVARDHARQEEPRPVRQGPRVVREVAWGQAIPRKSRPASPTPRPRRHARRCRRRAAAHLHTTTGPRPTCGPRPRRSASKARSKMKKSELIAALRGH